MFNSKLIERIEELENDVEKLKDMLKVKKKMKHPIYISLTGNHQYYYESLVISAIAKHLDVSFLEKGSYTVPEELVVIENVTHPTFHDLRKDIADAKEKLAKKPVRRKINAKE